MSDPAICPDNSRTTTYDAIKLFKRRWYLLLLFCVYSASNSYQWIEYSVIAQTFTQFYGVHVRSIDWLSMVYMAVYIPLIIPASALTNRFGLRFSAVFGALLNALGAIIKCASINPSLFWVTAFGQTICAIAQLFILNLPSKIAATWFGLHEVSTACSLGVFGNQVGVALGFLLPPLIVPQNASTPEVLIGINKLFISSAFVSTFVFVLIIATFKTKPPQPPSFAQLIKHTEATEMNEFVSSFKYFMTNFSFLILLITYGINTGCFYAISTLLSQVVQPFYPNHESYIGWLGLTMVFAGFVGSIFAGMFLDKTKAFKKTTIGIYAMSFLFMLIFTLTLSLGGLWIVFFSIALLGVFMNGYLPVGFEFAAEITYPHSESTSSGLLNASAQLFGIILTTSTAELIHRVSIKMANLSLALILLAGTFMTMLIRSDLKRQNAAFIQSEKIVAEESIEGPTYTKQKDYESEEVADNSVKFFV